jgi:hypothetical protein
MSVTGKPAILLKDMLPATGLHLKPVKPVFQMERVLPGRNGLFLKSEPTTKYPWSNKLMMKPGVSGIRLMMGL